MRMAAESYRSEDAHPYDDTEVMQSHQAGLNSLLINKDPQICNAWRSDAGRKPFQSDEFPELTPPARSSRLLRHGLNGAGFVIGLKLAHSTFPLLESFIR